MPVEASDMQFRLSGGAANTDPNASLGAKVSNTIVSLSPTLNNLFDDVTPEQALAGSIEFRCIYVMNEHATDDLTGGKIWIGSQTPSSGTIIAIGLDPAGVGDGDTTGEATTISPEDEPPTGVTFTSPSTEGAALTVAAIPAQEGFAVWVRRTVAAATEAINSDPFSLTFKGTPA